jgi:hypothetical protein
MDCKQNSYKGETESVESGKDDRQLLAGLALGVDVVKLNGKRWHRANVTRRTNERETLASNQRNPKNDIKGKGLSPGKGGREE